MLLDIWMPDLDGISLLKEWDEDEGLPCPVIMMSGHGNVETAVEATRLGAYDFLEKPLSMAKLLLTVERALEADKLERENVGLRRRAPLVHEPAGRSAAMQRLREQVKRIAQHDTWVLITGEAGSGRETFARFLHSQSARKERPFVDLGVSAIARGNAARELFGSEEDGTSTTAAWSRPPAAPCCSTRSRTWTSRPRASCSARSTPAPSCASAAASRSPSTCASSPPPSAT
jgi:two-component system nitrogen regulation response regulator NtrX